eukprot:CAMPEP_0182491372 /NCGR_PEP_ID=MMETSP1321-20130603/843_1 /TAXON_ID=91990 /ORGANISM="Bolidomonas sp., Strain RCC1657" /LENGTH=428 /DNA_ID=CAMNT_0024693649 /DNA_START=315 /DNA_END=1601 /DNA_ORIENTATION=-
MSSPNDNENTKTPGDGDFTLPPLQRGVNLEDVSSTRSSSSSSSARSDLNDFDVAEFAKASFVAEPVFRSLSVAAPPPALTRHIDQPVLKEPPRSAVRTSSASSAAPTSRAPALPTTLPTLDRLYKDTLPATSFITVPITDRAGVSHIVNRIGGFLSKKSITYSSKTHSPHLLKCTAFSTSSPTPCVFYVNMFRDYESESVLVECSRWSGDCLTFVPIMKQIFLSADDSLEESNDSTDTGAHKSLEVGSACLDRVAELLQIESGAGVKEEEVKNALTSLGYYADSGCNSWSICQHPTLLGLVTRHAVSGDTEDLRLAALQVLRNLLCNADSGGKLVKKHWGKVEALCSHLMACAGSVDSKSSSSFQSALLSLEALNALMSFSSKLVRVIFSKGGEEVYAKCKEVGMGRHFKLAEVAIEGATELGMCGGK